MPRESGLTEGMRERRTLACGCVLHYERCFECRPGIHPDQETALAISLAAHQGGTDRGTKP